MTENLKTLSELIFEGGPIYSKLQKSLEEWKVAYKKRKMKGDESLISFLNHFGELTPELTPDLKNVAVKTLVATKK